jgi:mRNA interferase MazF
VSCTGIIWINRSPQVGQEMRDVHPFLVLSPHIFNEKTSLVIGLPMTMAEYNRLLPLNGFR